MRPVTLFPIIRVLDLNRRNVFQKRNMHRYGHCRFFSRVSMMPFIACTIRVFYHKKGQGVSPVLLDN